MKYFLEAGMLLLLMIHTSCEKEDPNAIGSSRTVKCLSTQGQAKSLGIASYPDAYKWTTATLASAGEYHLSNYPAINDIAVFNSNYHSSGPNAYAGHVARLKKIVPGLNGYTITFWGTNQPTDANTWKSECGCDNFSEWTFYVDNSDIANGKIKFFHLDNPNFRCGVLFVDSSANYHPTVIVTGDLNFGSVPINTSVSRKITMSNSGNLTVTIHSMSLPGGYQCNTSIAGLVLNAKQSITVSIEFSPTLARSYNGTLSIISNTSSGLSTIQLTGSGIVVPNSFSPQNMSPSLNNYSLSSTYVCMEYGSFSGTVFRSRITNINSSTGAVTFEVSKQDGSSFDFSGKVGVTLSDPCASNVETTQLIEGSKLAYLIYTPGADERTGSVTYYLDALQTTGSKMGHRYSCGFFKLTY